MQAHDYYWYNTQFIFYTSHRECNISVTRFIMTHVTYGDPYNTKQDAYLHRTPRAWPRKGLKVSPAQDEYQQRVHLHKHANTNTRPSRQPRFTDPNVYYDPDSYSNQLQRRGAVDFQKSMPTVTHYDTAAHTSKAPNKIKGTDGKWYDLTDSQAPLPEQNPFALRYGSTIASQKPEYVNKEGYGSQLFNVEPKRGPVWQAFFSNANVRALGDYFDAQGLGRPSAANLRPHMYLVYADNPDFLNQWRRDWPHVNAQVKRLNSVLIKDLLPQLRAARDNWLKYQYDAYYGYGHELIDRPISTATYVNQVEFNNRMF